MRKLLSSQCHASHGIACFMPHYTLMSMELQLYMYYVAALERAQCSLLPSGTHIVHCKQSCYFSTIRNHYDIVLHVLQLLFIKGVSDAYCSMLVCSAPWRHLQLFEIPIVSAFRVLLETMNSRAVLCSDT